MDLPNPPAPRPPRFSPAMRRLIERGYSVAPHELDAYCPSELDLKIAEALMGGNVTIGDIATALGQSPSTISDRLRDPITCAYVSRAVHTTFGQRLGLVDAALFARALSGNVAACKLIYERYDALSRAQDPTGTFQHMSQDELRRLLAEDARREAVEVPFLAEPPAGG